MTSEEKLANGEVLVVANGLGAASSSEQQGQLASKSPLQRPSLTTTQPGLFKQTESRSNEFDPMPTKITTSTSSGKPTNGKQTAETREMIEFRRDTVKRVKHLFLLFVRQFDVREFEIMVRFLRALLDKHKLEPLKMFGKSQRLLIFGYVNRFIKKYQIEIK